MAPCNPGKDCSEMPNWRDCGGSSVLPNPFAAIGWQETRAHEATITQLMD